MFAESHAPCCAALIGAEMQPIPVFTAVEQAAAHHSSDLSAPSDIKCDSRPLAAESI